jgi:hypothetical protein
MRTKNILYTVVPFPHIFYDWVGEPTDKNRPNHAPNEWSSTNVPDLSGSKPPWRPGEDTSYNDGRANVPGIQESRSDDSIATSGIQQRKERPQQKLEYIVFGIDTCIDGQFLNECFFRWYVDWCHSNLYFPVSLLNLRQLVELLIDNGVGFVEPGISGTCGRARAIRDWQRPVRR